MSKYDKIFEARISSEQTKEEKPLVKKSEKIAAGKKSSPDKKSQGVALAKPASTLEPKFSPAQTSEEDNALPARPRGRPAAKRSDPNFIGFTTYIRKDTHLKVKIALLQEGEGRELSELVEELFNDWLNTK